MFPSLHNLSLKIPFNLSVSIKTRTKIFTAHIFQKVDFANFFEELKIERFFDYP